MDVSHVTVRELQDGLDAEYGATLLRKPDKNGQLKELDDASLRALSDRVGGIPRGLELLVGYVRVIAPPACADYSTPPQRRTSC